MKYSFDKLFKQSHNKTRKCRKASGAWNALLAATSMLAILSLQSCMKQTLEEYGSTNGSNDISFICKENNGNSNSESNNKGKENDKTTKTAPTTSLTQPVGLFAYMHIHPTMNTGAKQFAHNQQIKPIGGGTGKAPII